MVGSVWIISNNPEQVSELLEHLNAPIQIRYELIQRSRMSWKYIHHLWQRFSPLSEIMNIFKGHFGFFEKDFGLNLVEYHLVLGFEHPHFKFK